jgi:hypothetical protein
LWVLVFEEPRLPLIIDGVKVEGRKQTPLERAATLAKLIARGLRKLAGKSPQPGSTEVARDGGPAQVTDEFGD